MEAIEDPDDNECRAHLRPERLDATDDWSTPGPAFRRQLALAR